ncbi:MAG TPA: hypothetical protein VFL41_12690, partial [Gaiellaceae bacterium]|nr:hypothetical protein [Gaiellaceae bacterium]
MGRGRLVRALVGVAGAVLVVAVAVQSPTQRAASTRGAAAPVAVTGSSGARSPARAIGAARPHRTPPLRSLRPAPPDRHANAAPEEPYGEQVFIPWADDGRPDGALQGGHGSGEMPDPLVTFGGIPNRNGYLPPDTNGDIGPNDFVQVVNASIAAYDRDDGSPTLLPTNINTLFGGTPICGTHNQGDPVVLYDQFARRWLASQFATASANGPYYECVAVSATSDPAGPWCGYEFLTHQTKFGDYPKFGVWPAQDAYFMTANQFGADWGGVGVWAFERARMMQCQTARFAYQDLGAVDLTLGSMLPADVDGPTAPPQGAAIPLVMSRDGAPQDELEVWNATVDWSAPSLSVVPEGELATARFNSNLCGFSWNCIPQPDTTVRLEPLSDRLMHRLAYRNFGPWQSMVVNQSVDVGGDRAGVRWYELTKTTGAWAIQQQGTFAPDDGLHRWMASAAMDKSGDIAVGYSVSSGSTYPSIRYAGRLNSDPPGVLAQGEATLFAGNGSQLSTSNRWGDYSMLGVDPVDDCTFWYTNEYYASTSGGSWRTRIGAFRFPSCGPPPPQPPPPPPPPPPPHFLYTQYDNASAVGLTSQNFEAEFDAFDSELADDFVVPAGQTWDVEGVDADGIYFNGPGPAESINVRVYANAAGHLPGALVAARLSQSYEGEEGDVEVALAPDVALESGTYWISVQANQDFNPDGQWGWTDRVL